MSDTRIPTSIPEFVAYMEDTDDYQLAIVAPATTANYLRWGWTAPQSAWWHTNRQKSDSLFAIYKNKKFRTSDNTEQIHQLIKVVSTYDHANHLLDNVANSSNSINTDYEKFKVKRGTPLQDTTHSRTPNPGLLKPVITVREITHLQQRLTVRNPEEPESRGLPEGMKFARVYRFIGTNEPTDLKQFEFIGNAKRGLLISNFELADLKNEAWYYARYESNTGVMGAASEIISAVIS